MVATATIRLGQVWADGDDHLALVVYAGELQTNLRYITGAVGRIVYTGPSEVPQYWRFQGESARLHCFDARNAQDAALHLTRQGHPYVLTDGPLVTALLRTDQVRQFACDAERNGWAAPPEVEAMRAAFRG